MNPDDLMVGLRIEYLFLSRTSDRYEREDTNALCQTFNPTANRRQRGFVTNQKPPIEVVGNYKRASGAADLYRVSNLCLLCPVNCRTSRMQGNVDGQFFGSGIEMSRSEI